jgi:hypothetical protein
MTEQQLRQLVREAIARVGVGPPSPLAARPLLSASAEASADRPNHHPHPSFSLLNLPSGDGPCIIEPGVACNHCGYCKSYGH